MNSSKNDNRFTQRKFLRTSRNLLIILYVVVAAVIRLGPSFALSETEAVVKRLQKVVIHFDEAAPGVYRGGLIPEEAVPLLKELGVKTVINFDNDEERATQEEARLKLFGIYTIRMPWSGWDYPEDKDRKSVV